MYYPNFHQQSYRERADRRLTVTGEGLLFAEPDTLTVQLAVRTEHPSVILAEQENAAIMNVVIQALIGIGIPRENIRTTSFTISPMYDFKDEEQVLSGYQVINSIIIQLNDISQAGKVIDTAVKHGVNQVASLQFSLKNPERHYNMALEQALENARTKAKVIADSLQVHVDPVPVRIVELQTQEPLTHVRTFAAVESFTPIEPGQISIRAVAKTIFQY